MKGYDTTTRSYQIVLESFNSMALDQPPADRMRYRTVAMEAVTGPDSGMVLDRLYKSVMSRASINFGKIPDSAGDLTKFTKYKTIADSITLLERSLGEYNIKELKLTRELHDTLIKCREDFVYGFKVDSQFIKTTYNSMVYALCEMINLCDMLYIDMLKAGAEGRQYTPEPCDNLILVQNVEKFVGMVKSGEWATTMNSIRKDARNLINVIYQDNGGNGSIMHAMGGIIGTVGVPGAIMAGLTPAAKAIAGNRAYNETLKQGVDAAEKARQIAKATLGDYGAAAKNVASKVWGTKLGKVGIVIMGIIGTLFLIRAVICLFYKGAYKLNDSLDDMERFLKAHMDSKIADPSGTSKSLEKQKAMYTALAGLHDTIQTRILKCDANARKQIKESNAKDFSADAFKADAAEEDGDADFAIG